MNDIEQNFLAGKLLRILRGWIDSIIPEETKNCIRTKNAIVAYHDNGFYTVVLAEDSDIYYDLKSKLDKGEINENKFKEEIDKIGLSNVDSISMEVYLDGVFVIIGYLDNKLTNAFILCRNRNSY